MTTLVGRFLPVPAKLNLITQQVSLCFNKKKNTVGHYFLLKFQLLKLELLRKYNLSSFKIYSETLTMCSIPSLLGQTLGVGRQWHRFRQFWANPVGFLALSYSRQTNQPSETPFVGLVFCSPSVHPAGHPTHLV